MKHLNFCLLRACLLLTFVTIAAASAAAQPEWQAGVAKREITPPQPMWMSGYAGRKGPAEGKLHDLWAKALVLQSPDGERLVLVSLDLVGIGRELSVAICKDLQKAHGLRRSQISICTSHTHTGPVVGRNLITMYSLTKHHKSLVDEYAVFLQDAVREVVAEATTNVQPASVSYGMGKATFAVNRRNNREADVPMLRENGELKGPVDHSAPVLAVRDEKGELSAVVFGYACHATVLGLMEWSGDWPGFAQIEIEKRHPEAIAMFVAGCGADQNPLPRRTVELAEEYGQQMATAVDEVLSSDMKTVNGGLTSTYKEIDLKLATLPDKETIEKDTMSSNTYIAGRAKHLLQVIEEKGSLDQTYPYPVQIWGIGKDARMVVLGGEVVVDYANRLREEFPEKDLWVAGYSNDVMAYIPSKRVLLEGGYEGASSMIYYGLPTVWSENVEEHIVKTVHELAAQLPK